jgi:hypothetical protein
MATQQSFLVCDNSTLANFKNWAQTISSFFTTAGWVQSSDTGQVNWGSIASVPGSGAYVYEIWQPNDGLTTFYLKIEYGNLSGTNSPAIRLTLSSTTNGSGTPTGFVAGPFSASNAAATPASAVTTYECDFFGNTGMISALMWRSASTGGINLPCIFNIERSRDSSGNATSTYVTLYYAGSTSVANNLVYNQQSIVFGVGVALIVGSNGTGSTSVPSVRGTAVTGSFNGAIPIDLVAPYVGYWDQNCTGLASAAGADFSEGVTFNATVYGTTMTYMPTKITSGLQRFGPLAITGYVICVRTA